ncbi:MAG: hypothetical protein HY815_31245, partial [Candidatus Riflebacteria bacterium]|nr:hypothetical protein [Candidatus Riflebacteria bacterium]
MARPEVPIIVATRAFVVALLLAIPIPASGWGWQAHRLITDLALDLLPLELRVRWLPLEQELQEQSVRPDRLAVVDPREAFKHYINPECMEPGYLEFLKTHPPLPRKRRSASSDSKTPDEEKDDEAEGSEKKAKEPKEEKPAPARLYFQGRIPLSIQEQDRHFSLLPPDFGDFERIVPKPFRPEVGTVVYQPAYYYEVLVRELRAGNKPAVSAVIGSLAHYVGDLHVPLHTTVNHNGRFTGNYYRGSGPNHSVHSRFETGLVKFLGPALRGMVARRLRPARSLDRSLLTRIVLERAREAGGFVGTVIRTDLDWFARHPGTRVQWKRYYPEVQPALAPIVERQMAASAQ